MSTAEPWVDVVVAAKSVAAVEVVCLELADPEGGDLPAFSAGAHIDVEIAPGLVRQYSISNHPADRKRYVIGILREPVSRGGSAAIHDLVQPSDVLRISQPRNHFPLVPGASRVLLFAGGIGVTPLLSMAAGLAGGDVPFRMHYCTRSRERAAFLGDIDASAFVDHVALHFDDGPDEQRLDARRAIGAHQPGEHLYVCGPGGFIDHILGTARGLGWPDDALHREYFSAPDAPAIPTDAFEVQLASSGLRLVIPADRSIVAVLQEHGVVIPVSCEQGVCGTCLTGVLAGEPDHRDMFMTDEEHRRNDQMTLCCSRARSPLLVLDL